MERAVDDRRWQQAVRPEDHQPPEPSGRYDLLVVGGGPAGLVAAVGAAGLGARVALVERGRLGGDCLNHGCVPSKSLIAAARRAALSAGRPGAEVFDAAMQRMRAQRADLSAHDSAERLRGLGIDLWFGSGGFTGPRCFQVNDTELRFKRACLATGARPARPVIEGLDEADILTNETVFDLQQRPDRMAIVGAGPIGCELGQSFQRLGVRVTLLTSPRGVLPREDREAAALVRARLEAEGVHVREGARGLRGRRENGETLLESGEGTGALRVDAVLAAIGRLPNVEDLGLEAAGVRTAEAGIAVDALLRTDNRRIFAAGDVASRQRFTHAADAMARIVITNALFPLRARADRLVIPRCTFTDPELAHVGPDVAELAQEPRADDVITVPFADLDRPVLDGDAEGFVRVHVGRGGRILGATVVGTGAGELIAELGLAMSRGIRLGAIAGTIHAYPTRSEAIKRAADGWMRGRLGPKTRALLRGWFALRR